MLAEVAIEFPGVPASSDETALIHALGRLTIAWSSSEFYLALLLQRLMASPKLDDADDWHRGLCGNVVMTSDMNAVFSLFFSVESSRGRRDLVRALATARHGEGNLVTASFEAIKALLESHGKIARNRNKYVHTAMGRETDGSYVLLDNKTLITRMDWTTRLRNPRIRAKNNRVDPKQIDDVVASIGDWIDTAIALLKSIETRTIIS